MPNTLSKNILVVYYSQSGQLTQILENLTKPLQEQYNITWWRVKPQEDFPFPWKPYNFYDAFPESVNEVPCALCPPEVDLTINYDLVIVGYQPWYLSPSIPINSMLLSTWAKPLFKGKKVITVIGSRNMWIGAQESVKQKITALGGHLCGNIVLRDRTENFTGIVTIAHWLFSGKKDRKWGILPKPGVSDKDIKEAAIFGRKIEDACEKGDFSTLQTQLNSLGATPLTIGLMSLEERGKKIFRFWARFIAKKGGPQNPKRRHRVNFFRVYLPTGITIFGPIILLLSTIFNLLTLHRVKKRKAYYKSIQIKNRT